MDEAGVTELNLLLLTKVTSPAEVLQSGGSYAIVKKQWSQSLLTATNINVEVAWNSDEILVISVEIPESFCVFPRLPCWFVISQ